MTVKQTSYFSRIAITGVTASVNVNWRFEPGQLSVKVRTVADPEPAALVYGVDFTTTGGDTETGGAIVFTPSRTETGNVDVERVTPGIQDAALREASGFSMAQIEAALDRVVMRQQEIDGRSDRTLRFPAADALSGELPEAAARAKGVQIYNALGAPAILKGASGNFVGFDVSGLPIAIAGTVAALGVSPFMATVLDDVDGAAARATLGINAAWSAIIASGGLNLSGLSGDLTLPATTKVQIGNNPAVDGSSPGGQALNVTKLVDSATSGTRYLQQNYFGVQPGGASTADSRAGYFRTDILANATIAKAIGASAYLYITTGGALLTTGFGVTGQIILNGATSLTSGSGILGTVRVENAGAYAGQAKGVQGYVTSTRASGLAIQDGTGVFGMAENQAGGREANVSAFQAELRNSGAGEMTFARLFRGDVLNLSTGVMGTVYGWYSALTNNGGGAITTWAHAYYGPRVGAAPTTERVILSDDTADSVFAGLLQAPSFKGPQNGRLRPLSATLADDSSTSFAIPAGVSGFVMFSIGQSNSGAIAIWDSVGTYSIAPMVENETYCVIDWTTGALAGATGTDNRITLSIHTDNRIYVENRSGGAISFVLLIIDRTA